MNPAVPGHESLLRNFETSEPLTPYGSAFPNSHFIPGAGVTGAIPAVMPIRIMHIVDIVVRRVVDSTLLYGGQIAVFQSLVQVLMLLPQLLMRGVMSRIKPVVQSVVIGASGFRFRVLGHPPGGYAQQNSS